MPSSTTRRPSCSSPFDNPDDEDVDDDNDIDDEQGDDEEADEKEAFYRSMLSTSEKGVVAFRNTHFVIFDKLVGNIEVSVNLNATLLQIATKPSLFIELSYRLIRGERIAA